MISILGAIGNNRALGKSRSLTSKSRNGCATDNVINMASWQDTLSWPRLVLFLALVFILLTFAEPFAHRAFQNVIPTKPVDKDTESWCPIPEPASHVEDGIASSDALWTDDILAIQVERLSAAVNVSTVSYSDNGDVDEDPRWKTFDELHAVLKKLFPLV